MNNYTPVTDRSRLRFSATQRVNASPEAIFPLLCPVREYEWIPEWDCELVYTESGVAEKGCIFQTDRPEDGGLDTWVISRHEPPQRISFVRINPLRVIEYDIGLSANADGSTRLDWEQVVTALDETGDDHVAGKREEDFAHIVEAMESLLEKHLARQAGAGA